MDYTGAILIPRSPYLEEQHALLLIVTWLKSKGEELKAKVLNMLSSSLNTVTQLQYSYYELHLKKSKNISHTVLQSGLHGHAV